MNKLVAVVAAAGLLVVMGFCRHDTSVRLSGEVAARDAQIARRDTVIDSLTQHARLMERLVAGDADATRASEAAWRQTVAGLKTHHDAVPTTVAAIVHSTTLTDTAKITQLVAVIDGLAADIETLTVAGNVLADSAAQLAASGDSLRLGIDRERAEWLRQRVDMRTQITAVKQQARRWGVGASLGYDPLALNFKKPRLNVGLVVIY